MSSNTSTARSRSWNLSRDRIVIFGGSPRTIDLLMLAVIRSDHLLLVGNNVDTASRRYAQRFAVEHKAHHSDDDIVSASTILVARDDLDGVAMLTEQARAAGTPIYVADQPRLSDFNILEFVERRSSTLPRRTPA